MEKTVYVFRAEKSWLGTQIPVLYAGEFIHEVLGDVRAKTVKFSEAVFRPISELLNYHPQHVIGEDVFLDYNEARATAQRLLDQEEVRRREKLDEIHAAQRRLEEEVPF